MKKKTSSNVCRTQVIAGKNVKVATSATVKLSAKKVSKQYAESIEILKNR